MSSRERWLTPRGALLLATLVTLLALVENSIAPWAPFYIVYAALITILPLVWRTPRWGSLRAVRPSYWLLAIACGLVMQVVVGAWDAGIFRPLVRAAGVDAAALDTPFWSFGAALQALFVKVGARWNADPQRLFSTYLLCIVVWAGFGEEVFYRGYLHEILARQRGFRTATVVSTAFFAVRHATQLALLAPAYPWGAAVSWVVIAALFGVVLSWLYARTRSLYPPILAHYVFNLVPLIAGLATGGGEAT
jgi:membrane protease YdiL (CAAX protease family)